MAFESYQRVIVMTFVIVSQMNVVVNEVIATSDPEKVPASALYLTFIEAAQASPSGGNVARRGNEVMVGLRVRGQLKLKVKVTLERTSTS
jgi:hypothetical protein